MRQLRKQRGMTLVSLMIGTVLSMLTILAMLALYKNLIQVAVEATQDASHDGGLASALLTAQMELASAGFGLEENVDTLVHLPNSAAVLWRYKDLDTLQTSCSGLLLREHPTKKERKYRTLTLLHKPVCSDEALSTLLPAKLDDALKLSDAALKLSWGDEPGTITNLAVLDPNTELTFEEDGSTSCSNYGTDLGVEQHRIIINASNSSSVSALKTTYTVCLANIPGSAGGSNNESS